MADIIVFVPRVAGWALGIIAAAFYFWRVRFMHRLFFVSVAVFFALALLLTFFQYALWKGDPLSTNLLPPHQSILYFTKYAGTHFWLAPLLSLIVSGAFYGILAALKRTNERFFDEGEIELGALAAFLAGWPRVIVFLSVVFLAVIVISGIKLALRKGAYTTLGIPFLIGLAAALACGVTILEWLGLGSLAVIPGAR